MVSEVNRVSDDVTNSANGTVSRLHRQALRVFRDAASTRTRVEQDLNDGLAAETSRLESLMAEAREAEAQAQKAAASVATVQEGRPKPIPMIATQGGGASQGLARSVVAASEAAAEVKAASRELQRRRRDTAGRRLALRAAAAAVILVVLVGGFLAHRFWETEGLYQSSIDLMQAGRWDDARQNLQRLLSIDSSYKDAQTLVRESYYRPALAALEAGKWANARSELQKLVAIGSNYKDAQALLQETYIRPAAEALEANNLGKAQAELQQPVAGGSKVSGAIASEAYYRAAITALGRGRVDTAADMILLLDKVSPAYKDIPSIVASKSDLRQAVASRYADRWLKGSVPDLRVLARHKEAVRALAFSSDGRILMSASREMTVIIWDPTSGEWVRSIALALSRNYIVRAQGVALSPDGEVLAVPDGDYDVKLWDVSSGNVLRTLAGAREKTLDTGAIAFSPDGKFLAAGNSTKSLGIWSAETGQQVRVFAPQALPNRLVYALAFSPDGKILASGGISYPESDFRDLQLWDVATGKLLDVIRSHNVEHVAFSPDGASLGVSSDSLMLWNVAARTLQWQVKASPGEGSEGVAFSPDGRIMASSTLHSTASKQVVTTNLNLRDATDGRTARTIDFQKTDRISNLTFSRDGRMLAAASESGAIYLWSVR